MVVKSPKFYFTDTGLACHLLGINTSEQASRDPLRGGLYENMVIMEILKARLNLGLRPELYIYRDTHGNEVDLLIREDNRVFPVEIKSAETFTLDFLKGIRNFRKVVGEDRCGPATVLYNGDTSFRVKGTNVFSLLRHGGYADIINPPAT